MKGFITLESHKPNLITGSSWPITEIVLICLLIEWAYKDAVILMLQSIFYYIK